MVYTRYKKTPMSGFRPQPPKATKAGCIFIIVFFGIIIISIILNSLGIF